MQSSDHSKQLQVATLKYAFFDGDNVGNTIENLLSNGRIAEATHLSEAIKLSIFQIELFVKSVENAEILIAGGDDVLIRFDPQKFNFELLQNISILFTKQTGLSMSYGVGDNVSQAITNLAKVKSRGKGTDKATFDMNEEHNNIIMKQTKLYIFTTSDVPDPYVNVITHCMANYENLNQIILIGITGDRRKFISERDSLSKLKQNIDNQLDSLAEGKYLKKKGKDWEEIEIDIEPVDCQIYRRLKDISFNSQVLIYEDLENEIQKFLNEDSVLHIFDVTAVLKSYLVDIYTILRFRNISTIYSFELFNERSYDYKDLIHNQTYKKTYDFICLSESLYTGDRIVVNEDSIISENDFNHLQSNFRLLQNNYEHLEDTLATDFARGCLIVYFLLLTPVFLWICWSIAQPEGWNRVEPLAYVVAFGWFLLNYLLQSLFTGKFPAFDPRELFNASKTWRRNKLQKSRLKISKW